MSLVSLIKSSIYSVKAHKFRVFLTMIGIIIGISSVVTILSVGDGLKATINDSVENTNQNKITINFESENVMADISLIEPFNKNDLRYIKSIDGVQKAEATSMSLFGMDFKMQEISYFDKNIATTIQKLDNKKLKIKYGRKYEKYDERRRVIILGKKASEELFKDSKEAISKGVTVKGINYEVIGVLEEENAFSLLGETSYLPQIFLDEMNVDDDIFGIDVHVKPGEDVKEIFERVKAELELVHPNLQGKYVMQDPQEITKTFEDIIGGITAFIAMVTAISLFVGGIGVMNIMYVSISERKREIGIRRAIGAKPKSIMLQFLIEAIIVTGIAGIIGIVLGILLGKIIGIFLPFSPSFTMSNFIIATISSAGTGIIFGIVPAIKASKMDPIKAIYM